MVGFLAHPNGNRRRHCQRHGAFKAVHRGDGGRQQAGLAEAVHGPISIDFVGQWKAQRKPPSCGRNVPMASPIPGPLSTQADGGGLRAEFAAHLLGFAQDLKSRKGFFRRLELRGAVPSCHGLDAGHQDSCTVACVGYHTRFRVGGQMPLQRSASLGRGRVSEAAPEDDGPNQKSKTPRPARVTPPKIHDGGWGWAWQDLQVSGT